MNRILPLSFLLLLISTQQLVDLQDNTFTAVTQIPLTFSKNFTLPSDWFIMFYAPWCHHCKQAIPEWVKLAANYRNNTRVGIVNCDNNPAICNALSIHGYPSLILFKKDGTAYDYRGVRRQQSFVAFLNGGYGENPQRELKKTSVGEYLYEFVNSLDCFSLIVVSSLFATFWFVVFRFLFSENVQELVEKKID